MVRCFHFYKRRATYVDVLDNLSLPGNLLHIYYLCCLNSVLFVTGDIKGGCGAKLVSESVTSKQGAGESRTEGSLKILLHQDEFYQMMVKMKKRPESIGDSWRFQHMLTVWLFNTYMDEELTLLTACVLDRQVDPFVYIQMFYDDKSRCRVG